VSWKGPTLKIVTACNSTETAVNNASLTALRDIDPGKTRAWMKIT